MLLDILDRVERQGQAGSVAGARYGKTRSAISGMVFRVWRDIAEIADTATKPENMNGGVGPRWWAK